MKLPDHIDMDAIVDRLHQYEVPAYVQQTGGGCATIYAGNDITIDDGIGGTYDAPPVQCGPGWFNGPGWTDAEAFSGDFYVGLSADDGDFKSAQTLEEAVTLVLLYLQLAPLYTIARIEAEKRGDTTLTHSLMKEILAGRPMWAPEESEGWTTCGHGECLGETYCRKHEAHKLLAVPACQECQNDGRFPDYDTVEAAGLDGTLRTKPDGLPWTWAEVERANDKQEAELAFGGAIAHLYTMLGYIQGYEDTIAEYPSELPSFDELVSAMQGIELA